MSVKFISIIAINLRLVFEGTVDIGLVSFLKVHFHSLANPGPLLVLILDDCYHFPVIIESLGYHESWEEGQPTYTCAFSLTGI